MDIYRHWQIMYVNFEKKMLIINNKPKETQETVYSNFTYWQTVIETWAYIVFHFGSSI